MTGDIGVDWETCEEDGCIGVRLPAGSACWAHADDQDVDTALKHLGQHGRLDGRGVPLTATLLERLLAAPPHNDQGQLVLTEARFHKATFTGSAEFGGTIFQGDAQFDEATFQRDAVFEKAVFQSKALFLGAHFKRSAKFDGAAFKGFVLFRGATFRDPARFRGATFQGVANFTAMALNRDAEFGETTFEGNADFSSTEFSSIFEQATGFRRATFKGYVQFDRATFHGPAQFRGATFQGDAVFNGATFEHIAEFSGATFRGTALFERGWFDKAAFQQVAWFDEATFQRDAVFENAIFQEYTRFDGATFQRNAVFRNASFQRDAMFRQATFQRDARFDEATFQRNAVFGGATFAQTQQLGPMLVRKGLALDSAVFHQRVQIEVRAAALCCQRARFLAGVQLRVSWAQIVLDDADLAAPSILAGMAPAQNLEESSLARARNLTAAPSILAGIAPAQTLDVGRLARALNLEEGRWARAVERLLPQPRVAPQWRWQPRLLSLRRADVAGLTMARVDLRACQFADAHNLDKLRIETTQAFAHTPTGWRRTARKALAEEFHWREQQPIDRHASKGASTSTSSRSRLRHRQALSWSVPAYQAPTWLATSQPLAPGQIASLYRALRKGREDNKDEPGAADFYYGEMEMRRHAKRQEAEAELRRRRYGPCAAATTEYAVLWLYWLISGYALKAWRALSTLAVVVLLAGFVFALWGFAPPAEPSIQPVAVDAQGAPIYAHQPVERPAGLNEWPTAIRFSAQAATALLRGPDRPLTALGEWLHMALRLVGPVLLGLALLSIRGRVKR